MSVVTLDRGRTLTTPPGKQGLTVAVPPEFGGPDAGSWTPEDLLVAAVASCYAVTLEGAVERLGVAFARLAVDGIGHVQKGQNGSVFTHVGLRVTIEADDESRPAVEAAVRQAEERCLVRRALDTPVDVTLDFRTTGARRAA